MRTILALCALVFVLAGCGGGATAGPEDTAVAWADALATHDYAAACALETEAYRGVDCEKTYASVIEEASLFEGYDVAADVSVDPASCGLDEGTGVTTCVATGKFIGSVLLTLEQVDGQWLVASTA